jgi:Predicted metal-dependent membrane protease
MGTSFDAGRGLRASVRFGQAVLVVIGAYVVASALTVPLTSLAVDGGLVMTDTPAHQILQTVVQFVGFGIAVGGFLLITDDWELVGYNRPRGREALLIAGGVIALLAVQFGMVSLAGMVGVEPAENQALVPGQENPEYFLYMIAVSVVVVGPAEELLFRGVVQGLLRRVLGATGAIVSAAGLFGLIHLLAVQGTSGQLVLYVAVATLLGGVLGYLYERTANIAVPGLAHGGYNACLFAIQYATAVGII